eukprot:7563929-Prorocentrum_lima.AAC.1
MNERSNTPAHAASRVFPSSAANEEECNNGGYLGTEIKDITMTTRVPRCTWLTANKQHKTAT